MTDYITSDWHFGHKNITGPEGFEPGRRQFLNEDEMDEALIQGHNSVVENGDVVYFLGDMSLHGKRKYMIDVLEKLKGNFVFVLGNHDSRKHCVTIQNHFIEKGEPRKFQFEEVGVRLKANKKLYFLTHYPMNVGSVRKKLRNLCGHIHGEASPFCTSINVGVDSPEMPERVFGAPVLLETVYELLEQKYNKFHEER